jgi:RimJ/RimL family protein N-acetyltransferase
MSPAGSFTAMAKIILADDDERVAEWVAGKIPGFNLGVTPYTAIGLANELGDLIAGVIFDNYTRQNINLHVAAIGRRWMTKEFLCEVFRYPFIQLGVQRVTGLVPITNGRAVNFDLRLGFTHEGTMRAFLPDGEDLLILGMLREECRWLNIGPKYGRRPESAAAAAKWSDAAARAGRRARAIAS